MRANLLTFLVVFLCPLAAAGQARWDPTWPVYGVPDALITTAFAALAITTELVGGPSTPRWDRPILADAPVRRGLGAERSGPEHVSARVSDATVGVLLLTPFVDAGVAGYGVHRDIKLATNFGLVSLESFAVTFGVTNLTKVLVGRARPRTSECAAQQKEDRSTACAPRQNVSFFSGHTSAAFTGAGLVCAFGTVVPLHGDGFVGQVPCISALTVAVTTALLRIVANKHHLTDVVVGAAVGLLSGWGWPALRFGRN